MSRVLAMTALVPRRSPKLAKRHRGALAPRPRRKLRELAFAGIRSETTVKLYAGDWRRFAEYLEVAEADVFDAFLALSKGDAAAALDEYLTHLESEGYAPATRARAKQAICSIVDKLYVAGVSTWTLRGLALIRDPQVSQYTDVEGLEHGAWKALLQAAESDGTSRGVRDAAILLLLHDSALRCREVATLRLRDFDAPKTLVRVWQKGRDVANRVPVRLTRRTLRALNAWCAVRKPHPQLFHPVALARRVRTDNELRTSDIAYAVRFWCRRAGVKEVGPHQLRHAGITRLAKRGLTLVKLQRFARHADVNTTTHYIHGVDTSLHESVESLLGTDED